MTRYGLWSLVVGLMTVGVAATAWADAQGGDILGISSDVIKSITYTADVENSTVITTNTLILGFKAVTPTALGACTLLDRATVGDYAATDVLDEWQEATAGETNVHLWPRPRKVTTAFSLDVANGAFCTIYYQ